MQPATFGYQWEQSVYQGIFGRYGSKSGEKEGFRPSAEFTWYLLATKIVDGDKAVVVNSRPADALVHQGNLKTRILAEGCLDRLSFPLLCRFNA